MPAPAFLRPLVVLLNWPAARFDSVRLSCEVALPPSDARAVLRGGIGTDPMFMSVADGIAASRRSEVVGSVDDEGRFEVYVSGRAGSGLGLVGSVTPLGTGSRVEARVAWTGLHKWVMPGLNLLPVLAPVLFVWDRLRPFPELSVESAAAYLVVITGGGLFNMFGRLNNARIEIPQILEAVERTLRPHRVTGTSGRYS